MRLFLIVLRTGLCQMVDNGGKVEGPLGIAGAVAGSGLFVASGLLGVSVTGISLGLGGSEEERSNEGADETEEQEENDSVLNGSGVESERGHAVGSDVNETQPGIALLVFVGACA